MHWRLFLRRAADLTLVGWRICLDQKANDMTTNTGRRGYFRTAMDAFIASRQREANRYVSSILLSMDDKTLRSHGYSRSELRKNAGD
jgi:hypothetical protein